ncbi:MAG: FAD-dependent oxidoreductase [Deltaproteobacteria bacterium]|nr:FAD-dependent oxidoreductase [Deltaproteobacteria bacterium]
MPIRPHFTRREILTAFLGLPAALAACRSHPATPTFSGSIVGMSDTIGHRIRDGLRVQPTADQWRRVRVVIVGAGIAGLTAAWQLQKAGCDDFVVLELERDPGGTARSGVSTVGSYPWGAHYLPVPHQENTELVAFLEEMGVVEGRASDGEPVVAEQYLCRDPQERVFYRGRWYEGLYLYAGASTDDLAQLHAFDAEVNRWVAWRDTRGRRAFALPLATCSDDAEVTALDTITMSEWLNRHGWHSPRLRWFINYACRDDYGLTLEQTSAWAGLLYFASRIRHPGDTAQPFITWPEGNGRFVAYLHDKMRAQVRLGLAAVDIIPDTNDPPQQVDVIAMDSATQTAVGFHAEAVIFAAPQFFARHLIQPYREHPPSHLGAFEYGSWLVANLFLRDRPANRGFPLAWDNVIYDSPSLGYVANTHQRGLDHGPTILTYYYPLCEADSRTTRKKLLGMDWESCADVVLTDLRRPHLDMRALVERLDIMRWGHAMIQPRPGFIWSAARHRASVPFRHIHFAHTDLSGVALFEEAFAHGVRAARAVLAGRPELGHAV